jgi:hypothetical protein
LINAWELSTEITSTELDSNTITAISPHLPEINNETNTTNVEEDDDESLEEQDLEPEVSEQISALEKISLIAMEDNTAYSAEMLNPIFNVGEEKKIDDSNENQNSSAIEQEEVVLQDVFHLMKRMQIKAHPQRSAFFKCFREAIFLLDKGDFERVKQVLNDSFKHNLDLWSSFCQSRIRRYIPKPKILYARVQKVFEHFKDLIREMSLVKCAKKILKHIERGCVSDPQGISLYRIDRKDSNGLSIYTCSRGTNSVESLHQKLARQFSCYHASAELGDTLLAELRHRHNSRAGIRNRGYYNCHHYDQYLVEQIQMLTIQIYGEPTVKNWPSSSNWISTKEKFGIIPMFGMPKSNPHPNLSGQYKFLAERMGTKLPYLPIHGKEELSLFRDCIKNGFSRNTLETT